MKKVPVEEAVNLVLETVATFNKMLDSVHAAIDLVMAALDQMEDQHADS